MLLHCLAQYLVTNSVVKREGWVQITPFPSANARSWGIFVVFLDPRVGTCSVSCPEAKLACISAIAVSGFFQEEEMCVKYTWHPVGYAVLGVYADNLVIQVIDWEARLPVGVAWFLVEFENALVDGVRFLGSAGDDLPLCDSVVEWIPHIYGYANIRSHGREFARAVSVYVSRLACVLQREASNSYFFSGSYKICWDGEVC